MTASSDARRLHVVVDPRRLVGISRSAENPRTVPSDAGSEITRDPFSAVRVVWLSPVLTSASSFHRWRTLPATSLDWRMPADTIRTTESGTLLA